MRLRSHADPKAQIYWALFGAFQKLVSQPLEAPTHTPSRNICASISRTAERKITCHACPLLTHCAFLIHVSTGPDFRLYWPFTTSSSSTPHSLSLLLLLSSIRFLASYIDNNPAPSHANQTNHVTSTVPCNGTQLPLSPSEVPPRMA